MNYTVPCKSANPQQLDFKLKITVNEDVILNLNNASQFLLGQKMKIYVHLCGLLN